MSAFICTGRVLTGHVREYVVRTLQFTIDRLLNMKMICIITACSWRVLYLQPH